jgi:hypothetical protein
LKSFAEPRRSEAPAASDRESGYEALGAALAGALGEALGAGALSLGTTLAGAVTVTVGNGAIDGTGVAELPHPAAAVAVAAARMMTARIRFNMVSPLPLTNAGDPWRARIAPLVVELR